MNKKAYILRDNAKRQRFTIASFKAFFYISIFVLIMSICTVTMHYVCGPYYDYGNTTSTGLIYFGWGLGLIFESLLYYISAISYFFWLYRASNNMHALAPEAKFKYSPVFNLVSYIIPIACLIWPYQAMKELWLNTKSDQSTLSEKTIGIWWVAFVCYEIINRGLCKFNGDGFQDTKYFAIFMVPSAVFGLVASYQMIKIMKDVGQDK